MQMLVRSGWERLLAAGILTVLLGAVILAWPGRTLLVVGILFGIYLVVTGVLELFAAFESRFSTSMRVLSFISGALSLVIGLFCFRDDLTSIALLGIWIGIAWLFRGTTLLGLAMAESQMPGRGWQVFYGVVTLMAGIVLLVWPISSIATLVLVAGIWMIPLGIIEIVYAVVIRNKAKKLSV